MKNEERSKDRGATGSRTAATAVLMVATFMDLMDSTITNVALPTIGKDLGATPEQLEWTLAGYIIAFATLLITGGRLGDVFGHRRIFVIGMVGFTLASLGAALSQSGELLVAARVLQGGFAGIMMPQVLSSVQVMYAPEERAPVLGLIGALSSLGAVGGLVLGGWLVTIDLFGMGWRSVFLVNVPVGVVIVAAALALVPRSRSEHPLKPDPAGALLGGLGVFLVVFPLTDGRAAGWAWWIWAMLAAAPFAVGAFAWQQRRTLKAHGSPCCRCPCSATGASRAGSWCRCSRRSATAVTCSSCCTTCKAHSVSQLWRQGSRSCPSHWAPWWPRHWRSSRRSGWGSGPCWPEAWCKRAR